MLQSTDRALTSANAPSTRLQEATGDDYRLTQALPEARTDRAGDYSSRAPPSKPRPPRRPASARRQQRAAESGASRTGPSTAEPSTAEPKRTQTSRAEHSRTETSTSERSRGEPEPPAAVG